MKRNKAIPHTGSGRPSILLALSWYSPAIHRGIARYARKENWILDLSMTRHGLTPTSWEGDGIIAGLYWDSKLYDLIQKTNLPVVNIGDQALPLPTVSPDNDALGKMAADYFEERGFKHYAFFLKSNATSARQRFESFQRQLNHYGHTCHLIDWCRHSGQPKTTRHRDTFSDRGQSEKELLPWLGNELVKLPKPVGIMTEIDDAAIEVLYACGNNDIPVPEQVAVLGIDDDELRCEFAPVPLSSIDCNQEAIGYEAAALLHQLLQEEAVDKSALIQIPPRGVTTRLSTDILAIEHRHVATVLKYIWQHYTEPINAKMAAAVVPISYRRLHDVFLQHIGRTIADEIVFKRLEDVKNLLQNTNKKAYEIALLCGFPNEDRMGRVFKRVIGITPLEFRRKFGKVK